MRAVYTRNYPLWVPIFEPREWCSSHCQKDWNESNGWLAVASARYLRNGTVHNVVVPVLLQVTHQQPGGLQYTNSASLHKNSFGL